MNGVELNRLGMQHRILRKLTLSLSALQKPLTKLVCKAFCTEVQAKGRLNRTKRSINDLEPSPKTLGEWQDFRILPLIQKLVAKANIHTFYGEEFGKIVQIIWLLERLTRLSR